MKNYSKSRSMLFFLEMILALILFLFTTVVLLEAFSKVNVLRNTSNQQTRAMIVLSNSAERIKQDEGWKSNFPFYYDSEFRQVEDPKEAQFEVNYQVKEKEQVGGILEYVTLKINQLKEVDSLWEMTFTTYRKK